MKIKIVIAIIAILGFIGCDMNVELGDPKSPLLGEWVYEYELLDDGTKNYDNPYVLLDFEYSDGFLLKEGGSGNSIWYQKINGDFEWRVDGDILVFFIVRADNTIDEFVFNISNLTNASMFFESANEKKYKMKKK